MAVGGGRNPRGGAASCAAAEDSMGPRYTGGTPPVVPVRPRLYRRGRNPHWSTAGLSAVLPRSSALAVKDRQGQNDHLSPKVYPGRRIFTSKKRLSPKVKVSTEETHIAYPDKGSRRSDSTGRFVPVKKIFKIKTKALILTLAVFSQDRRVTAAVKTADRGGMPLRVFRPLGAFRRNTASSHTGGRRESGDWSTSTATPAEHRPQNYDPHFCWRSSVGGLLLAVTSLWLPSPPGGPTHKVS
ncbi:hypothetical protein NDU88_001225 [Pleurodeles waltl]|uniref:Uncharacterized protein n=1 Tax=Pleurodeles waltl TaxID=8319 RepID=A0AAV7UW92_PLEWA|nr:hypothetical protein NDU88_001225 [Pleurodeles waltl]